MLQAPCQSIQISVIFHSHEITSSMKLLTWVVLAVSIFSLQACSYLPEEQIVTDVLGVYETRNYIEITPNSGDFSKTGFVFYPGDLVDPHAYVEPLSRFAVSGIGHKVIIVKMPGNLAIFDSKQGAYMFEDFPNVNRWVIGGHSQGGTMACTAVEKYPDYFKGLVLMAAYPKEKTDLSEWLGMVLSIKGEFDAILERGIIEAREVFLPPNTTYFTISGGNHSYFGKYEIQEGDSEGAISREEQTKITVTKIQNLYDTNGWD